MAEKKTLHLPAYEDTITIIKQMLSGGEILPDQVPREMLWSPEKELAAAVFMDGLTEVRDFCRYALHRRRVKKDLAWIFADDPRWPFSFTRLCEVFSLDPTSVRRTVMSWLKRSVTYSPRKHRRYRYAA